MRLEDLIPIPDLEGCKSLLVIQPHPDDNEIGAGAAVARLAAMGCKVTYLTVTDGRMGTTDPGVKPDLVAAIRRLEADRAAKILGVAETFYLDYPDGSYSNVKDMCESITGIIRKVRPELVMTVDPYLPYEGHPDHISVGMAAVQACMFCQFPGFASGIGEPCTVSGIAFYCSQRPNTFIDADNTWDLKIKALEAHASQFSGGYFEGLKLYMDFKARQYAAGKGFEKAEAFKVLSISHLHMNVDAADA